MRGWKENLKVGEETRKQEERRREQDIIGCLKRRREEIENDVDQGPASLKTS